MMKTLLKNKKMETVMMEMKILKNLRKPKMKKKRNQNNQRKKKMKMKRTVLMKN